MAEHDQAHPEQPSTEPSDVPVGVVIQFGLALGALILAVCFGLVALFDYFRNAQRHDQPPESPLTTAERKKSLVDQLPPAPELEGLRAPLNLGEAVMGGGAGWPAEGPLQADRERQKLARADWIDQKAGLVRLPIDQAMKRLAGKLPVRPGSPSAAAVDQFYRRPSASNSGRAPEGGSR